MLCKHMEFSAPSPLGPLLWSSRSVVLASLSVFVGVDEHVCGTYQASSCGLEHHPTWKKHAHISARVQNVIEVETTTRKRCKNVHVTLVSPCVPGESLN